MQGLHFKGFPDDQRVRLVALPCPLVVLRASPLSTEALSQLHAPRLQGFGPIIDPWLLGGCYTGPRTRSLLALLLPQVFATLPWCRLHGPSAHDLYRFCLTVTAAPGLQRFISKSNSLVYP